MTPDPAERTSRRPLPAPSRTHAPPAPTVGVRLTLDARGTGWDRHRVTAAEVDAARAARVPVCRSWNEVDLTEPGIRARGVVVLDRVGAP